MALFLDQRRHSSTWYWDTNTLSWIPWDGTTTGGGGGGTSNVNVVNTPAVTLSGTANVVQVTSGTVTLSGTSPVSVVGTASVTVTNTPAVTLSGTANTVTVTGTPAVTLSGTANVVSVTGTPAVTLSGTANVVSVTGTPAVNLSQVAGGTTVTSATGVQKVGVVGNAGASVDGATAAAVPANAILTGMRAATANPTAVTDGQMVALMGDKYGRTVVACGPQDLWAQGRATLTSTASTSLIAAGGANIKTAIRTISAQNTATAAVRLDILDGTTLVQSFSWVASSTETRRHHYVLLDPPYVGTANTALNGQLSAAVTDVRVLVTGVRVL